MTSAFFFTGALRVSLLALLLGAVAPGGQGAEKYLQSRPGELPSSPELERWFVFARDVEAGLRTGNPLFTMEMKRAHPYAKIYYKGNVAGRFRTEAASTSVASEIFSFNLARALGCGELFQPAVHLHLRGHGLGTLRHLLETTKMPEEREEDRLATLAEIASDPEVLHGAFKPMAPDSAIKYRALERPDLPPNGWLDEEHPLAKFLKHDRPQPGAGEFALDGIRGQAPAEELARQLSDILLVDALVGQWDRFSGNNLHVNVEGRRASFLAIDNGGAALDNDQGYLERFEKSVTRFDRPVAERLFELEAFLDRKGKFLGFANEAQLARSLNVTEKADWALFKIRVRRVAAHIRSIKGGAFFD
jgi:hypothetical protein